MKQSFLHWKHRSIRQRLVLITLMPLTYLFCIVAWHSYWSHSKSVDNEIQDHGKIISQLLAKSSEYELATNHLSELRLSLDNLIQSDPDIVSIQILDADRKLLLESRSTDREAQSWRGFETPIVRRVVWVDVQEKTESANSNVYDRNSTAQITGYVYVVMSRNVLQSKQQHQLLIELLVAGSGLLVSVWIALHLAQKLSGSLRTFIDACRIIRSGNCNVEIAVDSVGEIGELQACINDMAKSLQRSTQDLENKVAERTQELQTSRNEALLANEEKRKLIQGVQQIVEEDRKSIAAEVHDELNASLISIRLQAQRIIDLADSGQASDNSAEIKQQASLIKQSARQLYDSGRAMVRRLRPEVLDILGLRGAIFEMTDNYNLSQSDCQFICTIDGDLTGLENSVALSLYRIIQEALSNIIKHAHAKSARININLDTCSNNLIVNIKDDGQGFNQDTTIKGIGLLGMRERIFALNGEFTIISKYDTSIDHGTEILIRIPYKNNDS